MVMYSELHDNLNFLCGFKRFGGGALSESVLETAREGL